MSIQTTLTSCKRALMNSYKRYKLKRTDLSLGNAQKSIRHLLGKSRFVFVVTQPSAGSSANAINPEDSWCSARMVQPIVQWHEDDFTIWVGTSAGSRKVAEIMHNPCVTVTVGSASATANLIIHGRATVHRDAQLRRQYWLPEWRLFFPAGSGSEDYCVIAIEPVRIELMDFKHNVIPQPFGLRPLQLERTRQQWQVVSL